MSSSSDPNQVSSGLSLPQWMTSKISDPRFDENGAAFSPPSHDDSFFYIRYPISRDSNARAAADGNQNWETDKDGFRNLSDVLKSNDKQPAVIKVDYSKHTKPCQQFINGVPFPSPAIDNPKDRPQKSNGTDDGFKGKGAACGTSIVKVAQQMIASGDVTGRPQITRNSTVAALDVRQDASEVDCASGAGYDFARRRGSKSLPASPLGSPKTQRRNQNPYFTGTFFMQPVNNTEQQPPRGWLLSSLLGSSRSDIRTLNQPIDEAHEAIDEALAATVDDLDLQKKSPCLKAKPSELREMNFWSPTSM